MNLNDLTDIAPARARTRETFTDDVLLDVFDRVAGGESLNSICGKGGIPSRQAFFVRVAADETVKRQYQTAVLMRAETFAEEIIAVSDELPLTESGAVDGAAVARNKLRVDSRKWIASKLMPKTYGDKLELETKNDLTKLSEEELDARITALYRQMSPADRALDRARFEAAERMEGTGG